MVNCPHLLPSRGMLVRVSECFPIIINVFYVFSESFLNFDNVEKLASFSKSSEERLSFCIQGSVHQNHIDAPFVLQV
jgi:hypothetical protein